MGTFAEHMRAAKKTGAEAPTLCELCKKKSVTDAMASAYGK
jgi:hypothetical protein